MSHRLQPFHLQMRKITEPLSDSPQPSLSSRVPKAHIHSNSRVFWNASGASLGTKCAHFRPGLSWKALFVLALSQPLWISKSYSSHFMEWAICKNILYTEIFKSLSYFSQRGLPNESLPTLFYVKYSSESWQKMPFIKHLLLGTVLGTTLRAFVNIPSLNTATVLD